MSVQELSITAVEDINDIVETSDETKESPKLAYAAFAVLGLVVLFVAAIVIQEVRWSTSIAEQQRALMEMYDHYKTMGVTFNA